MVMFHSIPSNPFPCRDGGRQTAAASFTAYRHHAPPPNHTGNLHIDPKKSIARKPSGLIGTLRESAETLNSALLYLRDGLTTLERDAQRRLEERQQILKARLQNAETPQEWRTAAQELDVILGNEAWKAHADAAFPGFDAPLIETELKRLDQARDARDIKAMAHLVRTSLCRNLGGMDDVRLYTHSYIGTKNLVDRYVEATVETIRVLVDMTQHASSPGTEIKDVHDQVVHARQAFGRSALLISGGATFGMKHVGVLKALFEAKLLPRIISGASAGSIVCAVLCTRTDAELPVTLAEFPYGDLAVFEEAGNEETVLERIRRLLTRGAWIDIKHLTRVMQTMLGDMTFQEAYNRTRRILNIPVSSASIYELPRLLNYVTAPNVLIWSAVAASCSVPLLFSAAQLLVKNPLTGAHTPWNPTPQGWIDGSVDNDLPMTRLAEMFNVNHFIVSQVNPHVVPFIASDSTIEAQLLQDESSISSRWIYNMTSLAKSEALHRLHVLAEIGILPNLATKCRSVLSQKYSGDITILPDIDYKDFSRILTNPDADFMVQACLCGERATWPKLSRIRNHCAIELELDAAVQQLRARVVFSPSQSDLRRMTTGSFSRTPFLPQSAGPVKSPFFGNKPGPQDGADCESGDSEDEDNEQGRYRSRSSVSHHSTPTRPRFVSTGSFRSTLPTSIQDRGVSTPPTPMFSLHDSNSHPRAPELRSGNIQSPLQSTQSERKIALDVANDTDEGVDCNMDSQSSPDPETASEFDERSRGLGLSVATYTTSHMRYARSPQDLMAPGMGGPDWFSHSQPVTGGRDWVDATTSPRTKKDRAGTDDFGGTT